MLNFWYNTPENEPDHLINITYKDEDLDMITISSQEDFEEAINYFKGNFYKN